MGKHKEWRKLAKKARRKRLRRELAIKRDELFKIEEEKKINSPRYQQWLKEQEELEQFTLEEEKRVHREREQKWLEDELIAQEKWKKQQEIERQETLKRVKQEQLIREEWEKEEKKREEEREKKKQAEETRKQEAELMIMQIDEYIKGERDELPEPFRIPVETQPGQSLCPFYSKTGACRYKNDCSRNHIKPGISKTLLFPSFYTHFSLDGQSHMEYDTDISLEYEYSETYKHFVEFYNDIKYEFEKYGQLTQLKVCLNTSPHLRGNVYVSFNTEREALIVFRRFNGRYYAGRPISVEFIDVPLWKNALCGLQFSNKCPKGKSCNFLHVFKNPGKEFQNADRLVEKISRRNHERDKYEEEWRWSDSSTSDIDEQQKNRKRYNGHRKKTSRYRSRSRSRSHSRRSRARSRSRTPSRSSSIRSNDSKRNHSRSRTRRKKRKRRKRNEKNSCRKLGDCSTATSDSSSSGGDST